jgi:hypothetical protein
LRIANTGTTGDSQGWGCQPSLIVLHALIVAVAVSLVKPVGYPRPLGFGEGKVMIAGWLSGIPEARRGICQIGC